MKKLLRKVFKAIFPRHIAVREVPKNDSVLTLAEHEKYQDDPWGFLMAIAIRNEELRKRAEADDAGRTS